MEKYTFIFEYKRGTYINQVELEDIIDAVKKWFSNIDNLKIPNFGIIEKNKLHAEIGKEHNHPIPIKDNQNVWCMFLTIKRASCLINIVMTK